MANTNETKPQSLGKPQPLGKAGVFLQEVVVELRKTTWPTPKEAWRLTVVVIGVIVLVAVYVGAIDAVLTALTKRFALIK